VNGDTNKQSISRRKILQATNGLVVSGYTVSNVRTAAAAQERSSKSNDNQSGEEIKLHVEQLPPGDIVSQNSKKKSDLSEEEQSKLAPAIKDSVKTAGWAPFGSINHVEREHDFLTVTTQRDRISAKELPSLRMTGKESNGNGDTSIDSLSRAEQNTLVTARARFEGGVSDEFVRLNRAATTSKLFSSENSSVAIGGETYYYETDEIVYDVTVFSSSATFAGESPREFLNNVSVDISDKSDGVRKIYAKAQDAGGYSEGRRQWHNIPGEEQFTTSFREAILGLAPESTKITGPGTYIIKDGNRFYEAKLELNHTC